MNADIYNIAKKNNTLPKYNIEHDIENVLNCIVVDYLMKLLQDDEYELTIEQQSKLNNLISNLRVL